MTPFAERLDALPRVPNASSNERCHVEYRLAVTEEYLRLAVELLEEVANSKAGEAIFWGKAELIVKVQACQDLRTRFGLQDDARALVEKIKGELR